MVSRHISSRYGIRADSRRHCRDADRSRSAPDRAWVPPAATLAAGSALAKPRRQFEFRRASAIVRAASHTGNQPYGLAYRHRYRRHLHRRRPGGGSHRPHRDRQAADHAAGFRPGRDRRHPPGTGREPHRSCRRIAAVARHHRGDQRVAGEQGRARRLRHHARDARHPGTAAVVARRSVRSDAGRARGAGAAPLAVRDHRTDRCPGRRS